MKTAVQELVDELLFIESIKENEITKGNKAILTTAAIKQAIIKEKEQIIDAFEYGQINVNEDGCLSEENGAQEYYNQTYKPETI